MKKLFIILGLLASPIVCAKEVPLFKKNNFVVKQSKNNLIIYREGSPIKVFLDYSEDNYLQVKLEGEIRTKRLYGPYFLEPLDKYVDEYLKRMPVKRKRLVEFIFNLTTGISYSYHHDIEVSIFDL